MQCTFNDGSPVLDELDDRQVVSKIDGGSRCNPLYLHEVPGPKHLVCSDIHSKE
jgi:hypothetical protein